MKKSLAFLMLGLTASFGVMSARAQTIPLNATMPEKWQVGFGGSLIHPDYTRYKTGGPIAYGNYNFLPNFGLEVKAHYALSDDGVKEFTFASGPRYNLPLKHFEPFFAGMIGYGHFVFTNTPFPTVSQDSFIITYVGGVDVHLKKHWNARGEVDYQRWVNFVPNGLTPIIYSGGISYRR